MQLPTSQAPAILIVDDAPSILSIIERALHLYVPGCLITKTVDPEEALALARHSPPNVLITDLRMPGLDGITLSDKIRQVSPQTSTILITAHSEHLVRDELSRDFVGGVLQKPFTLCELETMVREALRQKFPAALTMAA